MIKEIEVKGINGIYDYNLKNIGNICFISGALNHGKNILLKVISESVNVLKTHNTNEIFRDAFFNKKINYIRVEFNDSHIIAKYSEEKNNIILSFNGVSDLTSSFYSHDNHPDLNYDTNNHIEYIKSHYYNPMANEYDEESFKLAMESNDEDIQCLKNVYNFLLNDKSDILVLDNIENNLPIWDIMKLSENIKKLSLSKQIIIGTNNAEIIGLNGWENSFDLTHNKWSMKK